MVDTDASGTDFDGRWLVGGICSAGDDLLACRRDGVMKLVNPAILLGRAESFSKVTRLGALEGSFSFSFLDLVLKLKSRVLFIRAKVFVD